MAPAREAKKLAISPPASMIEVDNRSSSSDELIVYDSASITSSVLDYEYENGRRYHGWKAGSYPLPNDEKELDRIDLKHHITLLLCDGNLHLAPIHSPSRVLDLGTGTGIWAIEMGDASPESEVHGVDLSPVQPECVPSNVYFHIDDVEAKDWTWPDNHFDYIHSRFMLCSISSWKRYIRKAFQHIKPGGYFELQELDCRFLSDDGSLADDSQLSYWSKAIVEAAARYNRPIPRYDEYYDWFVKAGFVDVQQVVLKCPTNPWPKDKRLKEVGKYQCLAHIEGLEGVSLGLLTRGSKWKADEVSVLMARVRPELKDRSIHSYQMNHLYSVVVVGRKPGAPSTPDSESDCASQGWRSGSSSNSLRGTMAPLSHGVYSNGRGDKTTPQTPGESCAGKPTSPFTPTVPVKRNRR